MQTNQVGKLPDFTPRELDILRLLAGFNGRSKICKILGISYGTLSSQMHLIFIKTGLNSQIELMQYAINLGLGLGAKNESPYRITEALNPSMLNHTKTELLPSVAES